MKLRSFLSTIAGLLLATAVMAQTPEVPIGPGGGNGGSGGIVFGAGQSQQLSGAAQVINITGSPYNAKCDGTTDDTAAINAAFLAAKNSIAYQAGMRVHIIGPGSGVTNGCLISSVNATIFSSGGVANGNNVEISDINLICAGAGNICFDAIASDLLNVHDITIKGSFPSIPEICIQLGTLTGSVSAAWNNLTNVHCYGTFALADLYNVGSEANKNTTNVWENNNQLSGPIGSLGSITGGSNYTNGTYTIVPLTGGLGHGALAKVIVSGNVVTSVSLTYEGRDYQDNDMLSASSANLGGTGSGFSVPVSKFKNYVAIIDGQDHWRATSAYQTVSLTPDSEISMTLVTFDADNMNAASASGALAGGLWMANAGGLKATNLYIDNNSGPACVEFYDSGVRENYGEDLNINCESSFTQVTSEFLVEGPNATPNLSNLHFRGYHFATTATFATAANITAVNLNNAIGELYFITTAVEMFSTASLWNVSGNFYVPSATYWNTPLTFQGSVSEVATLIASQVTFNGSVVTPTPGMIVAGGLSSIPTLTVNSEGALYTSGGSGAVLQGDGSTYDVTLRNSATSNSLGVLHGTTNVVTIGISYLEGTPSGSLASFYACFDPSSTPVGEITYQATNCTTSLRATKHGIKPYVTGLADAMAMIPETFIMNSGTNGRREIGLVAEDIQSTQDMLAGYQDRKLRTVQYDRVGVVAIAAIKAQQAEIAALRTDLKKLDQLVKSVPAPIHRQLRQSKKKP